MDTRPFVLTAKYRFSMSEPADSRRQQYMGSFFQIYVALFALSFIFASGCHDGELTAFVLFSFLFSLFVFFFFVSFALAFFFFIFILYPLLLILLRFSWLLQLLVFVL